MTQEEKTLLLKDLCARLPYGVIVQYKQKTFSPYGESTVDTKVEIDEMLHHRLKLLDFKPYLRSLTSMTEEEKEEYFNVCDEDIKTLYAEYDAPDIIISDRGRTQGYVACKELEWFYEHHFDFIRKIGDKYTTLTDMGLAIKAPKEMYNTKK